MLLIYVFHAWMQIGMELIEVYMSRTNHQSFISISFLSHSKYEINKSFFSPFSSYLLPFTSHLLYTKSTRLLFLSYRYFTIKTYFITIYHYILVQKLLLSWVNYKIDFCLNNLLRYWFLFFVYLKLAHNSAKRFSIWFICCHLFYNIIKYADVKCYLSHER
jgi:hypothetical protein